VLWEWTGIDDHGGANGVGTTCFMDVPADDEVGLERFNELPYRRTSHMFTEKNSVDLCLGRRRVAYEDVEARIAFLKSLQYCFNLRITRFLECVEWRCVASSEPVEGSVADSP
jgi:hypothetical protein